MSRVAEIEARIEEMNRTYHGCDWCCGGGDKEMDELCNELEQLLPYDLVHVDVDGKATNFNSINIDSVNEHINNLKANESLSVYSRGDNAKHVGGAFVDDKGRRTVSFLKE